MSDITQNAAGIGASPPEPLLPTLDDYLEAFSQQPSEVIDGEIVPVHPPGSEHSFVIHFLYDSLRDFTRPELSGRLLIETAYLLDADERSDWVRGSRIPDLSYITAAQLAEHKARRRKSSDPLRLVPVLAVEIISPHDAHDEITRKITDYLRFRVQMMWLISPRLRTIKVYTQDKPEGTTLTDQDTLTGAPIFEGWSMPVARILDEAME
jgi:Uma2 family endonuclease